jgi:hypothetical protein
MTSLILKAMKKLVLTSILALLVAAGTSMKAQNNQDEYLGLPGDNLNLYAVMNLFQGSKTLEEFERNLNSEDSRINNLDLNGDNIVDYISVSDHVNRSVHNIVLSVSLGRDDRQDVAVFTVQRFRNGSVQIQLIGDEALYGKNYIVEPIYADNDGGTLNPGYSGYDNNVSVVTTSVYEVATWPLIRFMFAPDYIVWNSSWYWGYYPSYWHAWSPFSWHYYYGYQCNWYPDYYRHYRHWDHLRYAHYHDFYYRGIRSHSNWVSDRIREGNYRGTYSHPEQRREGEDLYRRTHSDRNSIISNNNSDHNSGRRINSTSADSRNSGNRVNRTNERNNRSIFNNSSRGSSSQDRIVRNSQRSNSSVQERSNTNRFSTPKTETSRKSMATIPDRPSNNRSYVQNNRSFERSAAPSERVTKREMRSQTVSTSRPANINQGSQNHRIDREVRTEKNVSRSDKSKSSETRSSSHRR